jgi:hypothetical protein
MTVGPLDQVITHQNTSSSSHAIFLTVGILAVYPNFILGAGLVFRRNKIFVEQRQNCKR